MATCSVTVPVLYSYFYILFNLPTRSLAGYVDEDLVVDVECYSLLDLFYTFHTCAGTSLRQPMHCNSTRPKKENPIKEVGSKKEMGVAEHNEP